ncbi:MAG: N-6 DNA methylase [Fimbriimonadaceae bacterium]|nr:N-6 DNA methylase [Fimbriimonadaceae bacterium]
MSDPFVIYLRTIEADIRRGNAREHTHRPTLKILIESLAAHVHVINEPARTECGAPDLLVERRHAPIGFVETKDTHVRLDSEEESEQLCRYRKGLSNLILTNYIDFVWFVNGEARVRAKLTRQSSKDVAQLLEGFLNEPTNSSDTPRELAQRLARLAHLLRDILDRVLQKDQEGGALRSQLEAFREVLISDMTDEQFTDMYAQTITYGLFAARCNAPEAPDFSRKNAAWSLPRTNPFLRQIFNHVAGPELDDRVAWIVDCIAEVVARANIKAVLENFGKARADDPVVHFYETFLGEYDKKLRDIRGVYYTPKPVVEYMVRSVDRLLSDGFGVEDGLADRSTVTVEVAPKTKVKGRQAKQLATMPRLLVLDPAVGTGAFLQGVIEAVRNRIIVAGQGGGWRSYVREFLLPKLYGFELLMAPYIIAHMKLSMQLDRDADATSDERLRVYLTNSLEEAWEHGSLPIFAHLLVEEARAAGQVKQELPIMVVLGNPPYSGHSSNKRPWISDMVRDYRKDIPELSKPGQGKWLQDDYVKFIRFAQWRIERTGYGVLAYITNHAWLDNPTFRGMRKSLRDTFDDIWILDLHGNSKKKERAPDGSADENVFDIQQGVAISLFVRYQDRRKARKKLVRHAELWGSRDAKYDFLSTHDVANTPWSVVTVDEPMCLFVPRNAGSLDEEFAKMWDLAQIFNKNGDPAPGILTTQDEFAISWTAEEMAGKIERFRETANEAEAREIWRLCSQSQWNYGRAKTALAGEAWRAMVKPILYRPFDVRYTVYDRNVAVHRRERMSGHVVRANGENLLLLTTRQTKDQWNALCTQLLCAHKSASRFDITFAFPLWLYPDDALDLSAARCSNLREEFVCSLPGSPDPEQVFSYIYAVLHSPSYRERYAQHLRSAFPRLPSTANERLFRTLAEKGGRLVGLHARGSRPAVALPRFPVEGTNMIDVTPSFKAGRVWINARQYFEGVPEAAWTMQFGGYTVASKWLADRKDRDPPLSFSEILTYQTLIGVLVETMQLMGEIDVAIEEAGGWPLS